MPRGRPRSFDTEVALDAALHLFWRHGYEGTSMAALTAAMGVNVPSLYAAFGNKQSLFKKAVDRYIDNPASYLGKALAEPTARGVAERLLYGAISMTMDSRNPDGCLLVHGALATSPDGEVAKADLAKRRAAGEAHVRKRFERAIAQGDLPRGTDPTKLARYLMTVVWGMSVQAASGATRQQLKDIAEFAMRAWPT